MRPNSTARPECSVLAGPNGAGKSSLFRHVVLPGKFINADDIARELNPSDPDSASLQAGRIVLQTIEEMFLGRQDFVYETTLSSRQSINLLKRARAETYHTLLVFIALKSADLHVARVEQRVHRGGHNIPEAIIRRRYELAFENLQLVLPYCDEVVIYDNSGVEGYRELAQIKDGCLVSNNLDRAEDFDRRVAACIAAGLGIPLETIRPDAG